MMPLDTLLDMPSAFEVVRDQIAAILVNEIANQKALAGPVRAGEFGLQVFSERFNPWTQFQSPESAKGPPLVCVNYDASARDASASDIRTRTSMQVTYNLDCVGAGIDSAGLPGDEAAILHCQRAVTLTRLILSAAQNRYLGLRGFVDMRTIDEIAMFQVPREEAAVVQVSGARIRLKVRMNEYGPEDTPAQIDGILTNVTRADDGQILAQVEQDFTS